MFPKTISVKALPGYYLWIEFADGVKGKVDLSHLKGKGVFKIWKNKNVFEKVHIDKETSAIAWCNDAELCADSLYLKIIGKSFQQWREEVLNH